MGHIVCWTVFQLRSLSYIILTQKSNDAKIKYPEYIPIRKTYLDFSHTKLVKCNNAITQFISRNTRKLIFAFTTAIWTLYTFQENAVLRRVFYLLNANSTSNCTSKMHLFDRGTMLLQTYWILNCILKWTIKNSN